MLPTSCPRCESEQRFIPKLRETNDEWQEVYIRCTVCRYQQVIDTTTPEIEAMKARLRKMHERREYEEDRHGQSTCSTSKAIVRMQRELGRLSAELTAKVQRQRGSTPHPDAA